MIKVETWKVINESEFNEVVSKTYGRPYHLQQQGDMLGNDTTHRIEVSKDGSEGCSGGSVSLNEWLAVDPETHKFPDPRWETTGKHLPDDHPSKKFYPEFLEPGTSYYDMHWERDFYPDMDELLDDLLEKGLIEEGTYQINVSW